MPILTGRRDPEAYPERWLIYRGDVHAGHDHPQHRQSQRCAALAMALRLLSGIGAGRMHGGQLRGGAIGIRFRKGETTGIGPRRNIGASIGASVCWQAAYPNARI
jgi:hypothetical protein